MTTKLETLQAARDDAQRYLRFVERCGRLWVVVAVGTVLWVLILLAFHFGMRDGLSPTVWVVGGVLGWVVVVGGLKVFGWLLLTLTKRRIDAYEKAIEGLERGQ